MRRNKILLLGYIVKGPLGGLVWHHLQYVLGLKQLGYDVLFLEYSEDYDACYDPSANVMTKDPAYGLAFIQKTFDHFDLGDSWAYFDEHSATWYGQSKASVSTFIEEADILINLSGITSLRSSEAKVPVRLFLDTDPLFTQIKNIQDSTARAISEQHTHHFTFAENINNPECLIPDDGFNWKETRQPIILSAWPQIAASQDGKFSTVMQWDSYKTQVYKGEEYGMKSKSFAIAENIPSKVGVSFQLAVGSATAPKERLQAKGWELLNPLEVTKTAFSYQDFIARSKGEFTIAKHGYVASYSGWFSERSAAYLASGRPVITQETGLSNVIDSGAGLLTFSNEEEAIEALHRVNESYAHHCKSALEIAKMYFDSKAVLTDLLKIL